MSLSSAGSEFSRSEFYEAWIFRVRFFLGATFTTFFVVNPHNLC